MAEARNIIRPLISITLIGLTVLGFYNVFGDNTEARATAELAACGKPSCSIRLLENARNPIGQSFEFQVGETLRSRVACHRTFYLLGDWKCEREGGPAPATSGSAK
jgi:hypothetical protein